MSILSTVSSLSLLSLIHKISGFLSRLYWNSFKISKFLLGLRVLKWYNGNDSSPNDLSALFILLRSWGHQTCRGGWVTLFDMNYLKVWFLYSWRVSHHYLFLWMGVIEPEFHCFGNGPLFSTLLSNNLCDNGTRQNLGTMFIISCLLHFVNVIRNLLFSSFIVSCIIWWFVWILQ